VQRRTLRCSTVAAIPLGRTSLSGSVLPTRRLVRSHTSRPPGRSPPARAGLFGIAARRDCPFHPGHPPCGRRPDSSLLLWSSPRGGQPLAATPPCAVRTFLQHRLESGTGGGLARFTRRLSASVSSTRHSAASGTCQGAKRTGSG